MTPNIRQLIVCAYQQGESQATIFHRLCSLNISRQFISYTIKRWTEYHSTADKPRIGRPRTVRSQQLVKRVKQRMKRNCRRSARKMGRDMHISRMSTWRVLHEDLGLRAFKRQQVHGLNAAQRSARLTRCKLLLRRFTVKKVQSLIFSDEKIFTMEERLNAQNDRVWALTLKDIPPAARQVQHFQSSHSIMVWTAISTRAKFPIIFISPGQK
jgi:inhibitor of nuclear factor kappa-B kinase subunit alpha